MRRQAFVLFVSGCVLAFVVSILFFYALGFLPFTRAVTIQELSLNTASWVGIRVRVQGNVEGLFFIPEAPQPPYNCALMDPVSNKYVGIVWPYGNLENVPSNRTVIVLGIVVAGQTRAMDQKDVGTVYYLRAESIDAAPSAPR